MWSTDLTEEETEALIQKAADEIRKRKLEAPAILFFEMHKPLAYIGATAGLVFAPFAVPFLGYDFVNDYSRLLADRSNVERLIRKLEQNPKPAEAKDS
jgi:hypothetical protein